MPIGLDLIPTSHPTGISFVTENLIRHLCAPPISDEIWVFCPDKALAQAYLTQHAIEFPSDGRVQLREYAHLSRHAPRSLHHMAYLCRAFMEAPSLQVPFLHDTISWRYPQLVHPGWREFTRQAYAFAGERAALITTISESARHELHMLLHLPLERIRVISPAARLQVPEDADTRIPTLRTRFGLPGRFILGASTLVPHKNFFRLIKSFCILAQEPGLEDVSLVIAGKHSTSSESCRSLVQKYRLEQRVVFTDYLPDSDLAALMSCCDVFVCPSLMEGFGLPVLEAMQMGRPVAVSQTYSLPEVVGEAGLYFNPLSLIEMGHALYRLLTDSALALRLGEAARLRAQQFSWHTAVETFLDIHRNL